MLRIVLVTLLILLLLIATAAADTLVRQEQLSSGNNPKAGQSQNLFSLFDPARFQMSQSYTISYASGQGGGKMIAMYLNQIDYQIARPLKLSIAIGWVHQPQSLFGASGSRNTGGQILPSFQLDWRPTKNFFLRFAYETVNPYMLNSHMRYRRNQSIFDNR